MGSSDVTRSQGYLAHAPRAKVASRSSSVPRAHRPPPEGAGMRAFADCSPRACARAGGVSVKEQMWSRADSARRCEECVRSVEELKDEASRLLTSGRFNIRDPKISLLLCESVRGPAWSNVVGRCDVCSTHLSQLKREAVRMLLTQNRAIWPPSFPASVSPGRSASGSHTLPRACSSYSPKPSPQPSPRPNPRHKPNNMRTDNWLREQATLWPLSAPNDGVSPFPETESQGASKNKKEEEKATSHGTVLCHFSSPLSFTTSRVSAMLPAGTSAAVSFIVRAVQKLNLTTRRRKQNNYCSRYPTNFSGLLQRAPPPTPAHLLQTTCKGREMPETGKVKVMLRVSPFLSAGASQSHAFKVDLRKRQVTVLDPTTQNTKGLAAGTTSTPKTFIFDAAFGPESSQVEVCEKSLQEVLQSVLAGADGCVLSFGQSKLGTSYTMIGRDDSSSLGIIPYAIAWLYKLINKKKDRTWANISVSVSAVELCGETEAIRDLLSDVESGDNKDIHKPNVFLLEDPVCGIQLCNNSVLSAPSAERAAFLLDAALASRTSGVARSGETLQHHCHMFYTLHVCQQHIESSSKSGMHVDQSKLSLIDLGSCTRERNRNNTALHLVDLGNVIMSKLDRHKHVPNKGSKLAMLMQDSLSNVNCRTTIVALVSTLHEDIPENLCTIQIVSQIRRLQKKTRKSTSSSPGGRSLGKEKKVNDSTRLRAFRSACTLDQDLSLPHLFDDVEDHSRSDKSCDTVFSMDPSGCVLLNEEAKESQEFVPIIPSLQRQKIDLKGSSLLKRCELLKQIYPCSPKREAKKQSSLQNPSESVTSDLECLKCNTFAELQNRLGCIDGSDIVSMYSYNEQPKNMLIKSEALSSKAIKSSPGPLGSQQSLIKEDIDEKGRQHFPQRDTPMKDIVGGACRHTDKVKTAQKIIPHSLRPDIVSCSMQGDQANESQSLTETLDQTCSLPLLLEGMSSDDSTLPSEIRSSPVGKSSSSSFSAGLGSPISLPVIASESIPEFPTENQTEMKATITVTVQQPLDLNGHDELIYSVVEEVTINKAVHKDKMAKITTITDPHSIEILPSSSQPVRIISSIGEEQIALDCASQVQAIDRNGKVSSSPAKNIPLVQNCVVSSQGCHSCLVAMPDESQNIVKDVSEASLGSASQNEALKYKEYSCEIRPGQKATVTQCSQGNGQHSSEICDGTSQKILPDFRMGIPENTASNYSVPEMCNSPSERHDLSKLYDSQDSPYVCRNHDNPETTIARKHCHANLGHLEWGEDSESLSSGQESDRDRPIERHKKPIATQCKQSSDNLLDKTPNPKSPTEDSSKLFSAKLEQIASRSQSLFSSHLLSFNLQTLEESNTGFRQGSSPRLGGCCTSPRVSRRHLEQGDSMILASKASLDEDFAMAQAKNVTSPPLSDISDEDFTVSRTGRSFKRVPQFFPMYDAVRSDITQLSKQSQSKISSRSKMASSPNVCKVPGTSPSSSCASPKSLRHSINRSPSVSTNGLSIKQVSWSTQSLSRKQGKTSISSKSPSRVLNGIELLQASGETLSSSSQCSMDFDDLEASKGKSVLTHTLPSPYSRMTAPRKPSHCSGHASDNTSVLSGELPPAMCKTALLCNRNSLVSSGYESMVRDSEATCSSTSIHDSISDQSRFFNNARGAKSSKKRNNIGPHQRRPSQDTLLSLRRSASGSKIRWVDRGPSDSYDIKVYEIDNVDGLQKRGKEGNKSVVYFSAKLKFLEHRQQRIAEVRAKYSSLKRELELAKQHLMVDPGKWTREFDLWQTFEVDSLEHLEALEFVTERLESQVSRCKAHVMMVTSFDVTPKRRQKKRCRAPAEYKGFMGV